MTTATIIEANSMSGSFMLPGMSSPELSEASMGRMVRFDNECILIPEATVQRTKLPLVRTYSLPLWKKKGNQLSDSDAEDVAVGPSNLRSPSPEESRARVVIKVPIPLFRRRASRSPTPSSRSVSTSPVIPKALSPCLVHRSPPTSPGSMPLSPVRRPSLPVYHRRKDELTVPLRPCCEACEHITDQSRKEGELWQEKFSRGAKRRRSASLDHNDVHHNSSRNEFFALSKSVNDMVGSSRYGSTPFSLTVDEVDKRRKSYDFSEIGFSHRQTPSPDVVASSLSHVFQSGSTYLGGPRYPRYRHERDVSSSSTLSSSSTTDEIVPEGLDPRIRLRSSPIEEEDEAQLFPLPSPRRSPCGTPSPSPSPKDSPVPSPHGSTSSLPAGVTTAGTNSKSSSESSKEDFSPSKINSSQESLLKSSLSRKQNGAYLASPTLSAPRPTSPDQVNSNSSPLVLSPIASIPSMPPALPTTHGMKIPTSPKAGERASAGLTSPKGPRSPRLNHLKGVGVPSQEEALKEFPTSTSLPTLVSESVSPTEKDASPPTTVKPLPPLRLTTVSIKPVTGFPTSAPIVIPSSPRTPTHGKNASSPPPFHSTTPPHNPVVPTATKKRKHSFTLPFIKAGEAIRDVSVDVLKGVNSISSAGVGSI